MVLLGCMVASIFASPVSQNGAIRRKGSKIVGTSDEPVQVAGPSLYWSIWGGEKLYNSDVIRTVATGWNASLVRAAIAVEYPGGYLKKPEQQINYAKTVVDAAIENGIYILVDWHDHNANQHIPAAKEFFSEMARTYQNTPNIIWEIWNEPDNENGTGNNGYDTWDDIRNYADSIIPVIRQYSSNLIVVGTPNWSADPATASKAPLTDSNVAYTLHFYAGTHGASLRKNAETAMSNNVAVFITEFGITDASGGKTDSTLYLDEAATWLDWADFNGISWANWSLSNIDEGCSELVPTASTKGVWTDADLSESGRWIHGRLLARPATQNADSALLLTTVQGNGKINVSTATQLVAKGTVVTFTAVPTGGWIFKGWSGASTATDNPLTLTINENSSLIATFTSDAGSNMLLNGGFTSKTSWFTWVDTKNGNEATASFTDEQCMVSIAATDTINWGIQISQSDLTLDSGATYTILLDAWSTDEREIFVGLSTAETWHFQGGALCYLTSEKTTHTITVVPDSSTDAGIFQINLGGSLLPVYLDNIQMSKTADAGIASLRARKNRTISLHCTNNRIDWTSGDRTATASLLDIGGRVLVPASTSPSIALPPMSKGVYLFVVKEGRRMFVQQIFR